MCVCVCPEGWFTGTIRPRGVPTLKLATSVAHQPSPAVADCLHQELRCLTVWLGFSWWSIIELTPFVQPWITLIFEKP